MPTPVETQLYLAREADTLALGEKIAGLVTQGMFISLHGNLGSGKTTLTRGLLRGLGFAEKVKSPTYTLVEHYRLSALDLYHFDFYRFNNALELSDAGFRDYFEGHNVCVVEWPERASEILPAADLDIQLTIEGDGRRARIDAATQKGKTCLAQLRGGLT
ncbi:MAG: tRNA (adenosine(37)-N6)-threonylcarbamoyltransferase complex ATPase subunit type 1 TsaE [Burkholderiales bacterium]|jgi:tRNA threonylcarbamoyladenosine biosynthesis protein TsaE